MFHDAGNKLQHAATHYNTLQHTSSSSAMCVGNTLQHTAWRCNMLQHDATPIITPRDARSQFAPT